jgi:ADP-heptose:LPS heptosyltransferase
MSVIKLKNLFILIKSFIFFIFHGKADKKTKNIRKILVVQTAKLGDMVCTTPVFRAIKEKYPEAKVYVLGNEINMELLEGNYDVDEYLIKTNISLNVIEREKFDFACLITPNFENLALCYLAGIPLISTPKIINGFSPYETISYKILRNFVIDKPHYFENYAPREYLRLLEPLNINTDDTQKHLLYSNQAEEKLLSFFQQNNIVYKKDFIVGIAPSVANVIKLWPAERFAKIANYLIEKHLAKVIIIGSQNDQRQVNEMIKAIDSQSQIFNTVGQFNLDELKALISKLKIFISVDTGPVYLAEALGVPTIDIIGPMAENEQPPRGKLHKIVQIDDREPQLHIMNARVYDKNEAKRQIEGITVEMVINELEELIKEL